MTGFARFSRFATFVVIVLAAGWAAAAEAPTLTGTWNMGLRAIT
jgi:hypothetical protein